MLRSRHLIHSGTRCILGPRHLDALLFQSQAGGAEAVQGVALLAGDGVQVVAPQPYILLVGLHQELREGSVATRHVGVDSLHPQLGLLAGHLLVGLRHVGSGSVDLLVELVGVQAGFVEALCQHADPPALGGQQDGDALRLGALVGYRVGHRATREPRQWRQERDQDGSRDEAAEPSEV